eukprot:TRINITY_DN37321_c0_g1_i1.p1 TRINITY_DN37321_c0_g1~~TRINITY_DN37321_c0_g1_i1.p1  ORF type:complete len:239 (-),score=47.66 TRINITY_DN37321_c0_g1_i1:172-888(-)
MSDVGSKPGSAGVGNAQSEQMARKERLRQLAMETVDLAKDPYFMRNHSGQFECKLCLTIHKTEGNYLAHTQGKKHVTNAKRREFMENKDKPAAPAPLKITPKRTIKIGRPGYQVTKQKDPVTGQRSLHLQIDYPEIEEGLQPRHRFMSTFEQKVEAQDNKYQYLLFAAEPYETIAFKIPNDEIDKGEGRFYTNWNAQTKAFTVQLYFVDESQKQAEAEAKEQRGQRPDLIPTDDGRGR